MLTTPSGNPASTINSPMRSADKRRLLGGLHHDGVAGGQRRRELPRLHQHREIPGNDLPDHADRLMPRVAEVIAVDRNGLALNLVGPAREIADSRRRSPRRPRPSPRKPACRCPAIPGGPVRRRCFSIRSARRLSRRPRSDAGILRQGPCSNAARAALTALSTSAASASATWQISSPVEGLMVAKVLPDSLANPAIVDQKLGRRNSNVALTWAMT